MKSLFVTCVMFAGFAANANPIHFKNCKSNIVTEVFTSCPGGEGGSGTVCGSQQTLWGSVNADLIIDSQNKSAQASLVYTSVAGKVSRSPANCSLGSDNWMECTTSKAVTELGKLTVSFNIDGIAPGVYFADIFADADNVPVGGFQNTDTDCEK